MKLRFLLPIFLSVVLVSCSSEDESGLPPQPDVNYFPLTVGNSWTYENEKKVNKEKPTQSEERLVVEGKENRGGTSYYDLESNGGDNAGMVTTIFANGELSKANNKLFYSGEVEFAVNALDIDSVEIPLENVVVFSTTADAGTELTKYESSKSFTVNYNGESIPIVAEYTVTTKNLGVYDELTINGQKFKNVLSSGVTVNMSVYADYFVDVYIISSQEVLKAKNYYADGVGMIKSEVNIHYEFGDLTELGVPNIPPVDIKSSQLIKSYDVINE